MTVGRERNISRLYHPKRVQYLNVGISFGSTMLTPARTSFPSTMSPASPRYDWQTHRECVATYAKPCYPQLIKSFCRKHGRLRTAVSFRLVMAQNFLPRHTGKSHDCHQMRHRVSGHADAFPQQLTPGLMLIRTRSGFHRTRAVSSA